MDISGKHCMSKQLWKRNLKKGDVMFNSIQKKTSKSGGKPKDMFELQSRKQNGDFLSVHPFEAT